MSVGSDTDWYWHSAVYCRHWCPTVNQCSSLIYLLFFLLRCGCRHQAKLTDHFGTPLAAARFYWFSIKFSLQIVHFGDVAGWGSNFIVRFLSETSHFRTLPGRSCIFINVFLILLSNRPFSVLLLLLLCLVLLLLLVLLMMLLMLLLSLLLLTGKL